MRKSSHSAERLGHRAVFNRRTLGRAAVSGRPLYGWSWACSCGKTGQHNGPLSATLAYWKDHTKPATPEPSTDG